MKQTSFLSLISAALLLVSPLLMAGEILTPHEPVPLNGTKGKFDFIKVDPALHRLLACHTGNGSLDVIDVTSSKLIKSLPLGAAQGVAIDAKNHRYFVSVSKPPKMVIVSSETLNVIGEVGLTSPADLVAYCPVINSVFVCNDEKPELWIIDPEARIIVTSITLPGSGMEDLDFNQDASYLFQNLKESSSLAKIDPKTRQVVDQWPTAPAEKPHGLAMVPSAGAVLIAGGTGKLVLMDLTSGKILASTDIASRVDEIAYDPALQQAYCASGLGTMSVVGVTPSKLTTLASIPTSAGAHSIAVDPTTHTVWIAYAKGDVPYVQAYTATAK